MTVFDGRWPQDLPCRPSPDCPECQPLEWLTRAPRSTGPEAELGLQQWCNEKGIAPYGVTPDMSRRIVGALYIPLAYPKNQPNLDGRKDTAG